MDEEAALTAVAEIAVAVAGFSGVAMALGSRTHDQSWSVGQRVLFVDLIMHSGIGLFASLIPIVMMHRLGSSPRIWVVASLIWAICACFGVGSGFLRGRKLPKPPGLEAYVGPVVLTSFFALIVLQAYNVVVIRAFWPYLAALVGNLFFAFVQFMRLVVPRIESRQPPD
jgi:hypothetical protein